MIHLGLSPSGLSPPILIQKMIGVSILLYFEDMEPSSGSRFLGRVDVFNTFGKHMSRKQNMSSATVQQSISQISNL